MALLGHPGLAAGVVVALAAAAELVAGVGTKATRRLRTGAVVTGPDVAPDVLATMAAGDVA